MRVTVALLLLLLACGPSRVADRLELHLAAHGAQPLAASSISYEPASNLMSARLGPHGRLVIERRDVTRPLTDHIPD
jgi:hypothetical protein